MPKIICGCKISFFEYEFVEHFRKCDILTKQFAYFDITLADLLNMYCEADNNNLLICRVFLKNYTMILEEKIMQK